MKTKKIFICTLIWLLILLTLSPLWVFAQDQLTTRKFGQEELDQMLAPVALYPDSLLAQILMAATYPLEVVQAERWAKVNINLKGDQFNNALDQKDWDPSVKALVPFPQVLSMMSENLEWTQELGDAFLDQEDEVMDTVQKLRGKAVATGDLRNTQEQKVITDKNVIEIEPADPEVVYVPVYYPDMVYGHWWYPAFPPFFFPPPPGMVIAFHGGIGFGRGMAVGKAWGYRWGHWNWRNHYVNVNINRSININDNINIRHETIETTRWQHDVNHRKGVSYRNETARERYGQWAKGAESRRDFRGFGQETRYQQAPGAAHQGPVVIKGRQASVAIRQSPVVTKGQQGSGTTYQGTEQRKGTAGLNRQSLDSSRDRSAFEGMDRGSDVRRQSDRGFQSRQSMTSKGTGSVSRGNVGHGR